MKIPPLQRDMRRRGVLQAGRKGGTITATTLPADIAIPWLLPISIPRGVLRRIAAYISIIDMGAKRDLAWMFCLAHDHRITFTSL